MTPPAHADNLAGPVPGARAAALALTGLVGVGLCGVLVGLLHIVVAPSQVDPVRRTISEYALGDYRPLFDAAVLLLAIGSAVVLVALVWARLLRAVSTASLLLATWSVALAVVVAFPKIDWSVGPTVTGYLHRCASLVAFVVLPLAGLALARRWRRHATWRRYAAWTGVLCVLSLAWLAPILLGFVLRPFTGVPWWRFVPLGLTERGLAVSEVAVVFALGWWAWQAGRRAAATVAPPGGLPDAAPDSAPGAESRPGPR